MAKKILLDSDGNFDTTYLRNKGINDRDKKSYLWYKCCSLPNK